MVISWNNARHLKVICNVASPGASVFSSHVETVTQCHSSPFTLQVLNNINHTLLLHWNPESWTWLSNGLIQGLYCHFMCPWSFDNFGTWINQSHKEIFLDLFDFNTKHNTKYDSLGKKSCMDIDQHGAAGSLLNTSEQPLRCVAASAWPDEWEVVPIKIPLLKCCKTCLLVAGNACRQRSLSQGATKDCSVSISFW